MQGRQNGTPGLMGTALTPPRCEPRVVIRWSGIEREGGMYAANPQARSRSFFLRTGIGLWVLALLDIACALPFALPIQAKALNAVAAQTHLDPRVRLAISLAQSVVLFGIAVFAGLMDVFNRSRGTARCGDTQHFRRAEASEKMAPKRADSFIGSEQVGWRCAGFWNSPCIALSGRNVCTRTRAGRRKC